MNQSSVSTRYQDKVSTGGLYKGVLLPDTNQKLYQQYMVYVEDVLQYSPSTVYSYKYVLTRFLDYLGSTNITEVTLQDIDAYFLHRHSLGYTNRNSENTNRAIIRSFAMYVDRYLGIRLRFDYSMIRNVKTEMNEVKFADLNMTKRIIEVLDDKQDKLIIALMFATGMRIGEVIGVTLEDYHTSEISVKGKGGKRRVVPIHPEMSSIINDHITRNQIRCGPLFTHTHTGVKKPYTVHGYRNRLIRKLKPHGIKCNPHMFRHGNATTLLQNGADVRTVQALLGHTHIQTTMRYMHVTDRHLKDSYLQYFPQSSMKLKKLIK